MFDMPVIKKNGFKCRYGNARKFAFLQKTFFLKRKKRLTKSLYEKLITITTNFLMLNCIFYAQKFLL